MDQFYCIAFLASIMVGPTDMMAIEEEEMEEVSEAAEKEKKVEVGGWRRS